MFRQNMYKKFVGVAASIVLAGCGGGGGGGGGAETGAPQTTKQTIKPVQVSAIGDSTMSGLELVNGKYVVTGLPHQFLQANLQAKFDATVTVTGPTNVGGTIQNLLRGVEGYPPYATFLASAQPDIVIADFGINDYGKYDGDTFAQYMVDFIDQTRAAGKIPVLEEPTPPCNGKDPLYSAPDVLYRNPFVDVIDNVGYQKGVVVLKQYDALQANPAWCSSMMSEGTHPNEAGYALRAQREADQVAPIVQQARIRG